MEPGSFSNGLKCFSEEFSNIKDQVLDMKMMMMMMPRGAPEQKHPKRGKSKKKIVSARHLQLFRSEES